MFCGNFVLRKVIGFSLVCVGVILLLCFLPFWMWLAFLGAVLIALGLFVLIRGF